VTATIHNLAEERAKRQQPYNAIAGALVANAGVWFTLIWWWL